MPASRFFPVVLLVLLFPTFLHAQLLLDKERIGKYDDPYSTESIWEIGFRGGPSFRSEDRFENDLENFSSTFQPGIFSRSKAVGFREQRFREAMVRMGFSSNQRFGFVYGELDFLRAGLNEFATDGFLTRLNFNISTNYFIFTYHYLWRLNPSWGIEAGLGFGGNETRWKTDGFSTNGNLYFPQDANLRGTGISFRMDNSLNYRVSDHIILQTGWIWQLHSVPSFSGTWNGDIATFFIREDGRTTPLAESRLTDSILITNQFARALDMNSSHFGLHFSVLLRFSY